MLDAQAVPILLNRSEPADDQDGARTYLRANDFEKYRKPKKKTESENHEWNEQRIRRQAMSDRNEIPSDLHAACGSHALGKEIQRYRKYDEQPNERRAHQGDNTHAHDSKNNREYLSPPS
jgi:hypothetical protein